MSDLVRISVCNSRLFFNKRGVFPMKRLFTACAALCLVSSISAVQAAQLTSDMTTDDTFSYYISSDDTQLGTLIGSGNSWSTTYTFTTDISSSSYLHVVAADTSGVIAGFIGNFQLSDSNYSFSNGMQTLLTDASHWSVSATGFGQNYQTPTAFAYNAEAPSPWGFRTGISGNASWIWTNSGHDLFTTRYFSTPITAVPEPVTCMSLIAGIVCLLAYGLQKRK